MAYPKTYEACKDAIHIDDTNKAEAAANGLPVPAVAPVMIKGVTRRNDESAPPVLIAEEIVLLDQALERDARELIVHVNDTEEERRKLESLREIVEHNAGETRLIICVHTDKHSVFMESKGIYCVKVNQNVVQSINALFGEFRCGFRADKTVPVPKVRYIPKKEESQEKEDND